MRLFDGLGATNGPDPTITMWPAYHQNGVSNTPQNPPTFGCDPWYDPVSGMSGGCPSYPSQPPLMPPPTTPPPPPQICPPGMYDPVTGKPCGGGVAPYPPMPPMPRPPMLPMPPSPPVYTFMYPPQQAPVSAQPQLIAGISNTTLLIGGAILLLLVSRK